MVNTLLLQRHLDPSVSRCLLSIYSSPKQSTEDYTWQLVFPALHLTPFWMLSSLDRRNSSDNVPVYQVPQLTHSFLPPSKSNFSHNHWASNKRTHCLSATLTTEGQHSRGFYLVMMFQEPEAERCAESSGLRLQEHSSDLHPGRVHTELPESQHRGTL